MTILWLWSLTIVTFWILCVPIFQILILEKSIITLETIPFGMNPANWLHDNGHSKTKRRKRKRKNLKPLLHGLVQMLPSPNKLLLVKRWLINWILRKLNHPLDDIQQLYSNKTVRRVIRFWISTTYALIKTIPLCLIKLILIWQKGIRSLYFRKTQELPLLFTKS